MAEALRAAFSELFERNEYAYDLSKDKITGLITEITGSAKDDTTTKCIVATFLALTDLADFDAQSIPDRSEPDRSTERAIPAIPDEQNPRQSNQSEDVNLAVSYTINLNLPETTNPEVFNAIFRALKEHLLSRR